MKFDREHVIKIFKSMDYDPVVELVKLAKDEKMNPFLKRKIHETFLKYLLAQPKPVSVDEKTENNKFSYTVILKEKNE